MTLDKGPGIHVQRKISQQLLWTAEHFSKLASQIESTWKETGKVSKQAENQAYAIGAVFCSVAFLEAAINELYSDAQTENVSDLDKSHQSTLGKMWDLPSVCNASLLEKYQSALILCGNLEFNVSINPYQDVSLLCSLRNKLVHFRPDWVTIGYYAPKGQKGLQSLEKKLRGKFPENTAVSGSHLPFFPDRCLGYGCAEWAVTISGAFFGEFCKRMGFPRPELLGSDTWVIQQPK